MKKMAITAAAILILLLPAEAQRNKDVLYLKTGARIFGNLQEISDNQYKIWVNDSTMFTIPLAEVEKYTRAGGIQRGRKESGLGYYLEAGVMIGPQSATYDMPFSFNALIHYTLSTTHIFGIGTGIEYLGKSYTPIFLEYRKLFHAKGTTPYIFARLGGEAYFGANDKTTYSYSTTYFLNKDYFGGATYTLGTGISWSGNGTETNLSFAYRFCHTGYVQSEYGQTDVTYTTNYNRLELKLGFRF